MALTAQFVNAKELRVAIGELNSTGLVDPKIRTVGVKKEAMLLAFTEKMKGVPEAEEAKLAESTIVFFNKIMEGNDPTPDEIEAKKKETTTKKAAAANKGPSNEQKAYDLMKAGAPEAEWNKVFGEFYTKRNITDKTFVAKRIAIYKNIAKKRLAKEGTPVAEPDPPVAETPPAEEAPETPPAEEAPATPPAEDPPADAPAEEPVAETPDPAAK